MFLAIIYFMVLFLVVIYTGIKNLLIFRIINNLLLSIEQEFATPRAIILLMSCAFCLLLSSVLLVLPNNNLNVARMFYVTSLGLILFLVLIIPLDLMYNWGAYFPIYIKGQSIKKNIIFEWLTDYIHVLSFFLRINIQLIRFSVITGVFYLYNNLYIEFIYTTLAEDPLLTDGLSYIYAGVAFVLKLAANLLYEIGHLWIIIGMQSGAFAVIVVVITQFLYSVYLIRRLLPFLKNIRSQKKV